jgi:serine acetyltransferase
MTIWAGARVLSPITIGDGGLTAANAGVLAAVPADCAVAEYRLGASAQERLPHQRETPRSSPARTPTSS